MCSGPSSVAEDAGGGVACSVAGGAIVALAAVAEVLERRHVSAPNQTRSERAGGAEAGGRQIRLKSR